MLVTVYALNNLQSFLGVISFGTYFNWVKEPFVLIVMGGGCLNVGGCSLEYGTLFLYICRASVYLARALGMGGRVQAYNNIIIVCCLVLHIVCAYTYIHRHTRHL